MSEKVEHKFNLVRVVKAHLLPITNIAFNKMSTLFATGKYITVLVQYTVYITKLGSYDRTCKLFDTETGRELHSLEGHSNVVYTLAFNNPIDNLIVTGRYVLFIL